MRRRTPLLLAAMFCLTIAAGAAENWTSITVKDGLPGNEIQFLKEDRTGKIWIGTDSGLARWEEGALSVLLDEGRAWDVLARGPKNYWVGTGNGVLRIKGDSQERQLAGNTVSPILRYRKDVIWALAKSRRTEQNFVVEHTSEGWGKLGAFKDKKIADLYRTSDGKLWVAEDGDGVHEVNPKAGPQKAAHHLRGLNVTALMQDSKGRTWCGLWNRGVRVLEDDRWESHLTGEETYVLAIDEDCNGTVWVATSSDGLWAFDGDSWKQHKAEAGPINLLSTTSDGRVWISTQSKGGLEYWDGDAWQVSLPGPLPIRCVMEADNAWIWAGGILDGIHLMKK